MRCLRAPDSFSQVYSRGLVQKVDCSNREVWKLLEQAHHFDDWATDVHVQRIHHESPDPRTLQGTQILNTAVPDVIKQAPHTKCGACKQSVVRRCPSRIYWCSGRWRSSSVITWPPMATWLCILTSVLGRMYVIPESTGSSP